MQGRLEVTLLDAGKKFKKEWLFRRCNLSFGPGSYAILGNNGAGKSTFLLSIAGFYALSEGKAEYRLNEILIPEEAQYSYYSLISPALELPEELTVEEFIRFHFRLHPMNGKWSEERIYEETGLLIAKGRQIRNLSSGMKQRLKLCMAFCSKTPLLLLDEPCTNLDRPGTEWYRRTVMEEKERTIIIASNLEKEYDFCDTHYRIEELKG